MRRRRARGAKHEPCATCKARTDAIDAAATSDSTWSRPVYYDCTAQSQRARAAQRSGKPAGYTWSLWYENVDRGPRALPPWRNPYVPGDARHAYKRETWSHDSWHPAIERVRTLEQQLHDLVGAREKSDPNEAMQRLTVEQQATANELIHEILRRQMAFWARVEVTACNISVYNDRAVRRT